MTPAEDLRNRFLALKSRQELADLLGTEERKLCFLAFARDRTQFYRTFLAPKRSGGFRTISAPRVGLANLQERLKPFLDSVYKRHASVHGFVNHRGIASNARRHLGKRNVLNVDLKDFFPSINLGRVLGLLKGHRLSLPHDVATAVARLVTHENSLPQGAATSPVISNLIAASLDKDLFHLATSHGCYYTRYADDITFSTDREPFPAPLVEYMDPTPRPLIRVGPELRACIEANGFAVNEAKVYLRNNRSRQTVTGLTVNKSLNVRRTFVRQVRAMLHAWEEFGYDAAELEFLTKYDHRRRNPHPDSPAFRSVVAGKLAFLYQILGGRNAIYIDLAHRALALDNTISLPVPRLTDPRSQHMNDVFICHATADKERIALPIHEACLDAGLLSWIDRDRLSWGDSLIKVIGDALTNSHFVLVIISSKSVGRTWPENELNAALSREFRKGRKVVLPLLVGTPAQREFLLDKYPFIDGKMWETWDDDPVDIAKKIKKLLEA